LTHSQVSGWTHLRVQLCVVAKNWDSEGAPDFQHYRGVEGHARNPGIRLGWRTRRSSLNLHPKPTTRGLVHIQDTFGCWDKPRALWLTRLTTARTWGKPPPSPHIIFSATLRKGYIQMALFPGTPKLESRNCPGWSPEIVPVGVPGLWMLVTLDCRVWSQRGLNQSCSPRRDLSNAMSYSQFEGWEEVDSRLLVVRSQIASLTLGPSFAHNLGFRCPNDQCEAIFDIYAPRPFQWHQEHLNARCFGPCCRALNIRESWRTPNPQLWEWEFHPPTSPKVGLRHWWTKVNFHTSIGLGLQFLIGHQQHKSKV